MARAIGRRRRPIGGTTAKQNGGLAPPSETQELEKPRRMTTRASQQRPRGTVEQSVSKRAFKPRSVGTLRRTPSEAERLELIELFQTARIAGKETRFDRLRWAASEFVKVHPEWSSTNAFIAVDNATRFGT